MGHKEGGKFGSHRCHFQSGNIPKQDRMQTNLFGAGLGSTICGGASSKQESPAKLSVCPVLDNGSPLEEVTITLCLCSLQVLAAHAVGSPVP